MTLIPILPPPRGPIVVPEFAGKDARLHDAAQRMEAAFLTEMLKSAGLGASRTTFGGGVGEDQFSSFLRDAQANEMAKSGGIGLAEALYHAMKIRADA